MQTREVHLKKYPRGVPSAEDFVLVETDLPDPQEGEVLVRNTWMSVDPYMRGRMQPGPSYVAAFRPGRPLDGGAIGTVIESKNGKFPTGAVVRNGLGWREHFVSNGEGLEIVDTSIVPPQSYLGVIGMPGFTAYAGLTRVGEIKPEDTVSVSAAAGAVGSVAVQIAKNMGCRVVGTAGSDAKVDWLRSEAGIDAAINYKSSVDLVSELRTACPDGIDLYFDNVGGAQLDAAIGLMNDFGRIVECGMISMYNGDGTEAPRNLVQVVRKRLRIQGFIVSDFANVREEFVERMSAWIAGGKMTWKETVFDGIERAVDAFVGLFSGQNLGKMLVKLGDSSGSRSI